MVILISNQTINVIFIIKQILTTNAFSTMYILVNVNLQSRSHTLRLKCSSSFKHNLGSLNLSDRGERRRSFQSRYSRDMRFATGHLNNNLPTLQAEKRFHLDPKMVICKETLIPVFLASIQDRIVRDFIHRNLTS